MTVLWRWSFRYLQTFAWICRLLINSTSFSTWNHCVGFIVLFCIEYYKNVNVFFPMKWIWQVFSKLLFIHKISVREELFASRRTQIVLFQLPLILSYGKWMADKMWHQEPWYKMLSVLLCFLFITIFLIEYHFYLHCQW